MRVPAAVGREELVAAGGPRLSRAVVHERGRRAAVAATAAAAAAFPAGPATVGAEEDVGEEVHHGLQDLGVHAQGQKEGQKQQHKSQPHLDFHRSTILSAIFFWEKP